MNTHGMGASDAPGAGRCIITAWAHQMRRSEPECARPLSSPSSLPPHGSTRPGLACVCEEEEEGIEPATLLPLGSSQSPIDPYHVNPIKAASSKPADESFAHPNLNHRRRGRRDSLIDMWCLLHMFALLYTANFYGDCVECDV